MGSPGGKEGAYRRRIVKGPANALMLLLALILIGEEWLWDALKAQMAKVRRFGWVRATESGIRSLGPWPSLLVLFVPAVVIFPFKLMAMWAIVNGHPVIGVMALVAAKLIGTAAAAYLLDLVRDSARKLVWFNAIYVWTTNGLTKCRMWLKAQPAYTWAKDLARRAIASVRSRWSGDGGLARRIRAARVVVRKWRCCLVGE